MVRTGVVSPHTHGCQRSALWHGSPQNCDNVATPEINLSVLEGLYHQFLMKLGILVLGESISYTTWILIKSSFKTQFIDSNHLNGSFSHINHIWIPRYNAFLMEIGVPIPIINPSLGLTPSSEPSHRLSPSTQHILPPRPRWCSPPAAEVAQAHLPRIRLARGLDVSLFFWGPKMVVPSGYVNS